LRPGSPAACERQEVWKCQEETAPVQRAWGRKREEESDIARGPKIRDGRTTSPDAAPDTATAAAGDVQRDLEGVEGVASAVAVADAGDFCRWLNLPIERPPGPPLHRHSGIVCNACRRSSPN
jgi:hypothetical protein